MIKPIYDEAFLKDQKSRKAKYIDFVYEKKDILSIEEIAEATGKSIHSVKHLIAYGRRHWNWGRKKRIVRREYEKRNGQRKSTRIVAKW